MSASAQSTVAQPAGKGKPGEPQAPKGVAAPKGPADPDAHFRLDEHERLLSELGKNLSPEVVAGVVHGAVSALHVTMQADTEKLLKAVREDMQTDRDVVAAVRELITVLKTPVTRTTTLQLPSGPVTVTTTETR